TWDLANGMARTEWDRDQKYPDPPVKLKYTETVSPTLGYVTDDKGSRAMSGIRVATHLRELGRASPWLLVKAMDAPKSVAATSNVPYQWVLRRLFLTRFVDSDSILYPPGGGLKLVELAPNVQQVQGGSANNLIVAMKDHLVIFDAPYGELQSRRVIDAAKEKYPGKPIKYL